MSSVNVDTGDRPWTTHAANVALKYPAPRNALGSRAEVIRDRVRNVHT